MSLQSSLFLRYAQFAELSISLLAISCNVWMLTVLYMVSGVRKATAVHKTHVNMHCPLILLIRLGKNNYFMHIDNTEEK